MKTRLFAMLVTVLVLCAFGAAFAQSPLDSVLAKLQVIKAGASVNAWRFVSRDVPSAIAPDYDDSKWVTGSPEYQWGTGPVGWMRTTIVVPESVGGVSVVGSSLTFRAGVDDDGELYVNGKLVQKFHWDQCSVVLSGNVKAGDKYVIVIKCLNSGGPGRLLSASVEYSALGDIRAPVQEFAAELSGAKQFVDREKDKATQDKMNLALSAAASKLDTSALDRGDKQAFLMSMTAARKELGPIAKLAKAYTTHLIGHGHIDMNWLWLWPETLDVCKNTFTTVLKLMDEYPEFRYSQSQASTYIAMEETQPELFKQIQKKVASGQWDITGGTWVEGDMNMASGESIVRQILYAKRYFKEKFNVEPVMCWEPDTFGHAWTIPQILAKSGLKYYYFMRCGRNEPIFWWEGPDGSRVLAYNRGSYNGSIGEDAGDSALDVYNRYGTKDGMFVYGVGDHGGGPTRADIAKAIELEKRSVYPTVKFDTTTGFFSTLEKSGKKFPVIKDELNFVFEGCYTTHSDAKKMNRDLENLLPTAEMFSVIAEPFGFKYPREDFVKAWRNTCFNQFHDIFDGSAIHGSYEYSKGLYEESKKIGDTALQGSLNAIAGDVDTLGMGIPVVVFNPLSWARTDVVRLDVPKSLIGNAFRVSDDKGEVMPSQALDGQIVFTAVDVPSVGYKVYHVYDMKTPLAIQSPDGARVIENEFFKVTLDDKTGAIASIFDKKANREALTGQGDALQCLWEAPHGMSAWGIGAITKTEAAHQVSSSVNSYGPVRILRVKHDYDKSSFVQDIILYTGVPRIDFKMTADWGQTGSSEIGGLMLKVAFPINVKDGKARFEIPFGSIERPANGNEVPGQKWIDVSSGDYGVSLLNDCKYGFDVKDNIMRMTLLRAPDDPDPTSDLGQHEINYSLYPHAGDWKQADTVRRGYEFNNPLIPLVTTPHLGKMPKSYSFLKVEPSNVIVTALKKSESGNNPIMRFYECEGEPCTAELTFGMPATGIWNSDLMERRTAGSSGVKNGHVKVPLRKWEIKTIHVRNVRGDIWGSAGALAIGGAQMQNVMRDIKSSMSKP